jgi:N,N'-diacetyllegionaminate synthase
MNSNQVIVIAEAGVNHNGDINIAKQMIDIAYEAGADYIKFQSFHAENIVSQEARMADYQIKNTGKETSQFELLKNLELSHAQHYYLKEYASKVGIRFLSTPFDLESIDLLKNMQVNVGKIPSGEITNLPYIKKMAHSFDEIILSTGMATFTEVKSALNIIRSMGVDNDRITVLHCTTSYPTLFEDVNLKAMVMMGSELGVRVGYSDHTLGVEVPIAAVALGAKLIEKHFTIDRNMEGPDHKASLMPDELKVMVKAIRNIEKALGSGEKTPTSIELSNRAVVRKSVFISRDLNEGEFITLDCLDFKRPGTGISPMEIDNIVGKMCKRNLKKGAMLNPSDIL